MDIHRVTKMEGEPVNWKLTHFANIGGSEEFVTQLVMEMPELVDASMIFGEDRKKLKEAPRWSPQKRTLKVTSKPDIL